MKTLPQRVYRQDFIAFPTRDRARQRPHAPLTWPTNADGYTLQSTTIFSASWSNVIGAMNIVGTNFAFPNKPNGNALFFRLMQWPLELAGCWRAAAEKIIRPSISRERAAFDRG
jgi:hypothetical protein